MTTEELKVVLRRSEHSGFGFSLLGTSGPPHVIYDIVENSPAADCGAVSLQLTHTLTHTRTQYTLRNTAIEQHSSIVFSL